mmetsp:Transcript_20985/g.43592  ORF Transcript_20985/g.43592 Transcript_20985/m.43592 type:complete len:84 (+) Transcript_20985:2291-2542(+)
MVEYTRRFTPNLQRSPSAISLPQSNNIVWINLPRWIGHWPVHIDVQGINFIPTRPAEGNSTERERNFAWEFIELQTLWNQLWM